MDRYLFDKRIVKKQLLKYGIMFLIALPFVITFNILCSDLGFWWSVLVDMAIIGFVVIVSEIVLVNIKNKRIKKEAEQEEQRRLMLKEKHKLAKQNLKKHKQEKNENNK